MPRKAWTKAGRSIYWFCRLSSIFLSVQAPWTSISSDHFPPLSKLTVQFEKDQTDYSFSNCEILILSTQRASWNTLIIIRENLRGFLLFPPVPLSKAFSSSSRLTVITLLVLTEVCCIMKPLLTRFINMHSDAKKSIIDQSYVKTETRILVKAYKGLRGCRYG